MLLQSAVTEQTPETTGPRRCRISESYRDDIERLSRRAGNFENLFDTETGFFRPKQNGGFVKPFAPNEVTFHFTEGNSWQYSFFVPHDVTRLMELMGGRREVRRKARRALHDRSKTRRPRTAGHHRPDRPIRPRQRAFAPHRLSLQLRRRAVENAEARPPDNGRVLQERARRPDRQRRLRPDVGVVRTERERFLSGAARATRVYDIGTPLFKEVTYQSRERQEVHRPGTEGFGIRTFTSGRRKMERPAPLELVHHARSHHGAAACSNLT